MRIKTKKNIKLFKIHIISYHTGSIWNLFKWILKTGGNSINSISFKQRFNNFFNVSPGKILSTDSSIAVVSGFEISSIFNGIVMKVFTVLSELTNLYIKYQIKILLNSL